jgi:hypothetical protein
LDIGFTLPADQVARDYKDSIDTAVRLVRENPDFRWTIESAWMLQQWLLRTQDEKAINELGTLMREGRISLGVAFGNMHSGLLGSEEMNRLVYLGESFRKRFGIKGAVAYQNDVPGFSWAYPRIFAQSGVKYLITGLNLFIGGGNDLGVKHTPFYWVGADGSRVLTWFTYDSYVEGYRWNLSSPKSFEDLEAMVPRRLAWLEQQGYPYDAYLLMDSVGDNADPTRAYRSLLRIREWNKRHPAIPMQLATAEEYFAYLIGKYGDKFTEASGDAAGHWEPVKLGAPEVASRMREASSLLPAAEALASFTTLLHGAEFPRYDFEDAWRELLTFHEHTPGAGPGWPNYYPRWQTDWSNAQHSAVAMSGYSNVRQLFDKAVARLSRSSGIFDPAARPENAGTTLLVYNGLSWARGGPVEVSNLPASLREGPLEVVDKVTGQVLPTEDIPLTRRRVRFYAPPIPSMGYRLFELRKSSRPPSSNTPFPLDVQWGPQSYLSSIRDIQSGTEFLADDPEKPFGALFISEAFRDYRQVPATVADPVITEGLFTRRVEVFRAESALRRTLVTLYRDAPYVDLTFDVDLDMMLDRSLRYAIAMPLAATRQLWIDGAGFVFRAPQDILPGGGAGQHAVLHFAHFEGAAESGITLATRDAPLLRPDGLFLLVSDGRLTQTRDEGAQRLYRTEPRGSNVQSFRFRLALQERRPAAWKRFGAEFNLPLQARIIPAADLPSESSFVTLNHPSVAITAFKPAESRPGWYTIRLQEIGGDTAENIQLSSLFTLSDAVFADLVENPSQQPADLSRLRLGPWETVTILVRAAAGSLANAARPNAKL